MFIYFMVVGSDILLLLAAGEHPDWTAGVRFAAVIVVATGFLAALAYRTGGRPRWHWGPDEP